MPYYHYTMTHKRVCPKCQKTLERSETDMGGNDGCIRWVAYIVAFPIFLIVFLIKYIVKSRVKNVGKTIIGNEVIECPKCKSKVVFVDNGTRLLMTEDDILNVVMPCINLIKQYDIHCGKVRRYENDFEEVLELEFVNNTNDKKCRVAIAMGGRQLIVFDNNIFAKIKTFRDITIDIREFMQHPEKFKPYYDYANQHYYSHEVLVTTVLQELL